MNIGTDIIEIDRIEQASQKDAFLLRVFTAYEREYAHSRGAQLGASLGGIYCAKEAALKALGLGMRKGTWQDLEVTHDHLGAPILQLKGPFLEHFHSLGYTTIKVSISHCKLYATSTVIMY